MTNRKIIAIAVFAFFATFSANAQHEHHNMQDTSKATMQSSDTMKMDHMNMQGMEMNKPMQHGASMSHAYSLNLPMNRNGSGTGWLPDASPMYGYMFHTPKWM